MIRRLRLWSGLVMLAYVAMHLLNHAFGLVSLEAMAQVLSDVLLIWGNLVGQTLLYGSFLIHYGLSLWALWERRSLRLRVSELSQIALGFAIPILLARHVVGTRIAEDFFDTNNAYYSRLLWTYFVNSPLHGYQQMVVLVVAWAHAMLGLHFWLRIRPWYARVQALALALAILVPVLSLLGMIEAGRHVIALAADPNWARATFAQMRLPSPATQRALEAITNALTWFFGGMVGLVLLAPRAPLVASPPRSGAHRLSRRPLCRGDARHQRARSQPDRRHSACACLRRARPLLDLPGAGPRRARQRRPAR